MLNNSQVWRRQFACFTASLVAAVQPALVMAQELPLPTKLLAENAAPAVPAPAPSTPAAPATTPISPDPAAAAAVLPDPNAPAPQPILAGPSQNVTLNLINRLVQKGVLSQGEAADLIQGAEQDAAFAKAQAQALAETQAAVMSQNAQPAVEPDSDEVRVTYIPEAVKAQIRDQLRAEVLGQARAENWAAPHQHQEWTSRIKLFGDIRMRHDNFMFPTGNDNITGAFPNFNSLNTGAPFDFRNTNGTLPPQLNADQDRERTRLRMRLGFDIDLEDGFTAGIRMATGGNNAPVSTNQTLGSTGSSNAAQGGGFSKYELWLDRAFIKYEAALNPMANLTVLLGRFDNPFVTNSQIMWDEDVGLDGIAFKINTPWQPGLKTFLTAGAFPVFTSYFNYAPNNTAKYESYNKYLLAAQFGVEFKITDDIEVKSTLAYYDWKNIEGQFSSPFVPASAQDAGNTDNSRPAFAQKGNTYRPIRNITATPGAAPAGNLNGTINQFQYFGLATKFRQIYWTGRVDFNHWEPLQVSLLGEFIKNVGLDKGAMGNLTAANSVVNNRAGGTGAWDGGDTAWYMGVNLGKAIPAFDKRGDWALGIGYRHVESDAVIDGFTDSVFGGGGSNMEGYTLNAAMALTKRTWFRMAYMSANQIAGPTLQTDVFLVDFTAKF
ncbi:MAG: putative porin [Prosthecobacter sp.]|uniref:putative porin n=1 Tax=Prosthecobacter sp. TaxID=1965333 RepID=UPI0038FDDB03